MILSISTFSIYFTFYAKWIATSFGEVGDHSVDGSSIINKYNNIHHLDTNINSLPPNSNSNIDIGLGSDSGNGGSSPEKTITGNEVLIMNANSDDRTASFFAQPGILAGEWIVKKYYKGLYLLKSNWKTLLCFVLPQLLSAEVWLDFCLPFSLWCLLSIGWEKKMRVHMP